ncbi:MAG: preprotein translocase subunit SecG [Holosporaceae bacterium]|jgi:preprotein translocase subunit SecG|nr:preprotein translocase subunit SecG [Holosporaceae bacterium]
MSLLSFLLAVHFVLTITIIGLILLQKHDSDGALGSSGGGAASGMFSIRGQSNILTRLTAILMTIFIINCLIMAKVAKRIPAKESIIDRVARETIPLPTNPSPPLPSTSTKKDPGPIKTPVNTKTPTEKKK